MRKRLYKSRRDKKISGVCGGLADYLDIDPSIVRLIWAAAFLFYAAGLFLYIVAAIILPKEDEVI